MGMKPSFMEISQRTKFIPAEVNQFLKNISALEARLASQPSLATIEKAFRKGVAGLVEAYEAVASECRQRVPPQTEEESVLPKLLKIREDAVAKIFEDRIALPDYSEEEKHAILSEHIHDEHANLATEKKCNVELQKQRTEIIKLLTELKSRLTAYQTRHRDKATQLLALEPILDKLKTILVPKHQTHFNAVETTISELTTVKNNLVVHHSNFDENARDAIHCGFDGQRKRATAQNWIILISTRQQLCMRFLSLKKLGVFFVSWNFITLRSTVVGWTWWRWSSLFYQSGQCLNRRIPDVEILQREIAAREKERNEKQATVDWRFTTPDARIKLKRLYPS